ncbi:MAG: hypothetical protein HC886_14755 [Leptolyngbyaceae cyanobacterium SM1_1_3]|nr:hypothetical protein [Leptolyngbyaceae cyanobacterium SM1_1_3]NJN02297.1 hypothetical protein [Leptolyngbyaceae cyanobacterium RM1_1_2]NJO11494.1 hypothetical protein [Leptolyngbyaceae cyanobacterium SL_1_1]
MAASNQVLYTLLLLHCTMGLIAALLAQRKHLNFSIWFIWGMVGGTLALVTALAVPAKSR